MSAPVKLYKVGLAYNFKSLNLKSEKNTSQKVIL
jgi:hypothetical protein